MIFKEISEKPAEYLSLLIMFMASAVLFITFNFDPHVQRRIVYLTAGIYFAWSLYHHYKRGDLHLSIIIEYLIFALLGTVVLFATI